MGKLYKGGGDIYICRWFWWRQVYRIKIKDIYIYIYIYIDVRSYVYNVVDGVIGSIKGKYLVCCTHKCCK